MNCLLGGTLDGKDVVGLYIHRYFLNTLAHRKNTDRQRHSLGGTQHSGQRSQHHHRLADGRGFLGTAIGTLMSGYYHRANGAYIIGDVHVMAIRLACFQVEGTFVAHHWFKAIDLLFWFQLFHGCITPD